MAWFYNFNFDEDKMYCMPIADMSEANFNKRKIRINKDDDTIPRTTNPYSCGQVYYKVHEFPACVYKRCFWLEERDDKLAEEIRIRYLEARTKRMNDEEKIIELKKEKHDLKHELYILRQRVDKLEQQDVEHKKCHATMNATIMMQFQLINALCDLTKGLAEDVARLSALLKEEEE